MACNNLQSIKKSDNCDGANAGGIVELMVIDSSNVVSTTVDVTGHTITAISASTDFVQFQFNRDTGNLVPSRKIDLVNGSDYFEVTVAMVIPKRQAAKSRALQILGEGQRFLDIIVKDSNGLYWFVKEAQLATMEGNSGTAFADGSKYNVTFIAKMTNDPYEVDSTIIPSLLA